MLTAHLLCAGPIGCNLGWGLWRRLGEELRSPRGRHCVHVPGLSKLPQRTGGPEGPRPRTHFQTSIHLTEVGEPLLCAKDGSRQQRCSLSNSD